LFRPEQLAVLFRRLFRASPNTYIDYLSAGPIQACDQEVIMNTRNLFTLITAATAVTALAAGMLLAISAPAPAADDFGQAMFATSPADQA
jgi:hypothetical protein